MAKAKPFKKYNKKDKHSYTLGAFPTVELIKNSPEKVLRIISHEDLDSTQKEEFKKLSKEYNVPFFEATRQVENVRDKKNIFVVGAFEKFQKEPDPKKNHVVLVNPSDMGNMGTIMRTALAFGIRDIAVIRPAVDIFNPKVVRSSMGALFHMNISYFDSFDDYLERYMNNNIEKSDGEKRTLYPFMLEGSEPLQKFEKLQGLFSLIFGNEATGLPDYFAKYGRTVRIENTDEVDSLNLSIAAGCALFAFTKETIGD